MKEIQIVWTARGAGQSGQQESEKKLTEMVNDGWEIKAVSATSTSNGTPIAIVLLQRETGTGGNIR